MIKYILIAILILVTSCKSDIIKPLYFFYKENNILLNLEINKESKNQYYGALKIANLAGKDFLLQFEENNILLNCNNKSYPIYRDGGVFDLENKLDYLLEDNKISHINIVLNSYSINDIGLCSSVTIKDSFYKKVRIISNIKSKEEIKQMINNLGKNEGNDEAIIFRKNKIY